MSKSQNFLEEIIKIKKQELSLKTQNTLEIGKFENRQVRESESRFIKIFQNGNNKIKLITELKFASPTNPQIGKQEELLERAKLYENSGADAISIITEKHFFKGDLSFISKVKETISLPILQKDFIIDPQQIYEAKEIGSDALLLIARIISGLELKNFVSLCLLLGIEPVVEINSEEDLEKALTTEAKIIAVNARDLETFEIDISKACKLIKKIPDTLIKLGFSGVTGVKEILLYKEADAVGVLVGTSLMKTKNIYSFINGLSL
jgi:indole-3-glycerol phosphate synthase